MSSTGAEEATEVPAPSTTDSSAPLLVLVTGATGFIAAHIIKVLLEKKYSVRATVRKLKGDARVDKLREACGSSPLLEFVEADLESPPEVWDSAVKDCVACIHTASPVKLTVKDPQKELLDPMLQGIANVFGACHRSGTVKKVVFTSSITALSDSFEKWKDHVYDSRDWNTVSSKKRNPYAHAKTMTERVAFEFAKVLKPNKLPETMDLPLRGALDGEMWNISYNFGVSDVRDTAIVHVAAMEHLPVGGETQVEVPRYIVWSGAVPYRDILKVLAQTLPERNKHLPKGAPLPNFLVLGFLKMTAPAGVYRYMKGNLSATPRFDVSQIERDLQIKLRPWEETIRDTAIWMKEVGLLKNK